MTALGALLSNQGIPRSGLSLGNKHMWSNTTARGGTHDQSRHRVGRSHRKPLRRFRPCR